MNEEWKEDYDRVHTWPLPDDLKARLITDELVKARLTTGADPLSLSIEKWEALLSVMNELGKRFEPHRFHESLREFIGVDSCALCIDSITKLRAERGAYRFREEKCEYCVLAKVQRCTDRKSAYGRIEATIEGSSVYQDPEDFPHRHPRLTVEFEQMLSNLRRATG